MTNAVGSTAQNIALQPTAARPVDTAVEAVDRELQTEAIESKEAVRQAAEVQPAPASNDKQPQRVDRYA